MENEEKENYKRILRENLEFYKAKIQPFTFVFYTISGDNIVVFANKKSFPHLIGKNETDDFEKRSILAEDMYDNINSNDAQFWSLFWLVNEDNYDAETLSFTEKLIIRKNNYFQYLFQSLLDNESKMYIYEPVINPNSSLTCEYLEIKDVNEFGDKGFIGIKGDDHSDKFWFNTVYVDFENRIKFKKPEKLKKIEIIPGSINLEDYSPLRKSLRNINHHINKDNVVKDKKEIRFLLKDDYKRVNKVILNSYKRSFTLKRSDRGKGSFDLINDDGKIIKKYIHEELHFCSVEETAKYIFDNYIKKK